MPFRFMKFWLPMGIGPGLGLRMTLCIACGFAKGVPIFIIIGFMPIPMGPTMPDMSITPGTIIWVAWFIKLFALVMAILRISAGRAVIWSSDMAVKFCI